MQESITGDIFTVTPIKKHKKGDSIRCRKEYIRVGDVELICYIEANTLIEKAMVICDEKQKRQKSRIPNPWH